MRSPVGGPSVGNALAKSGGEAGVAADDFVAAAAVVADPAAGVVAAMGATVVATVDAAAVVPATAVVGAELVLFAHPVATNATVVTTANHDRGLTDRIILTPVSAV
jgi:hypothetical protein